MINLLDGWIFFLLSSNKICGGINYFLAQFCRFYHGKHRCINFYINKFQIPSPTLRGVAKRPLILADMTFLTRLRSSEIPPLIVLAA